MHISLRLVHFLTSGNRLLGIAVPLLISNSAFADAMPEAFSAKILSTPGVVEIRNLSVLPDPADDATGVKLQAEADLGSLVVTFTPDSAETVDVGFFELRLRSNPLAADPKPTDFAFYIADRGFRAGTSNCSTARIHAGDGEFAETWESLGQFGTGIPRRAELDRWMIRVAGGAEGGEVDLFLNGEAVAMGLPGSPGPVIPVIDLLLPAGEVLAVENLAFSMENPVFHDIDRDGLPDDWERHYGGDPTRNDREEDRDGDGLKLFEEFFLGRHPAFKDNDADGLQRMRVYVSPTIGDDSSDGFSARKIGGTRSGPKRTIANAIREIKWRRASDGSGPDLFLMNGDHWIAPDAFTRIRGLRVHSEKNVVIRSKETE